MNMGVMSFINISLYCVVYFQRICSKFIDVINCLVVFLCIFYCKGEVSVFQFVFIVNLIVGFCIEWCLIQYDYSFLVCIDGINCFIINKQCSYFVVQFQMVIVFKFRCIVNMDYCVVIGIKVVGFVCVMMLFFYCSFKISFVNFDVVFMINISCQVNWEVIGVVQMESSFIIQCIIRKFCQFFIQ